MYQLKQIQNLGDDPEKMMYLGRSIPGLVEQGLPSELDSLDRSIMRLRLLKLKIIELGDDPVKLQYLGNSIPQLVESGLPSQLKEIETQIAFRKVRGGAR